MVVTGSLKSPMRMTLKQFSLAFLIFGALVLPASGKDEERKNGPLVVYGDNFMFIVQEPEGWTADIENAPKLSAGVVLVREGETFAKHGVLIAIRVLKKVDENTRDDLAHDMREFRNLYPDVQFRDLTAPHPTYPSHAKLFAIPRSRYDYVTYLNPGAGVPILFSVTMTTGKKEADTRDLKTYQDVVRSLEFIPQDATAPPR
jgi:hypothetical protein